MGEKIRLVELEQQVYELEEALALLLKAFDALLPGAKNISVDIGLLNEAAMKARRLVDNHD